MRKWNEITTVLCILNWRRGGIVGRNERVGSTVGGNWPGMISTMRIPRGGGGGGSMTSTMRSRGLEWRNGVRVQKPGVDLAESVATVRRRHPRPRMKRSRGGGVPFTATFRPIYGRPTTFVLCLYISYLYIILVVPPGGARVEDLFSNYLTSIGSGWTV